MAHEAINKVRNSSCIGKWYINNILDGYDIKKQVPNNDSCSCLTKFNII